MHSSGPCHLSEGPRFPRKPRIRSRGWQGALCALLIGLSFDTEGLSRLRVYVLVGLHVVCDVGSGGWYPTSDGMTYVTLCIGCDVCVLGLCV